MGKRKSATHESLADDFKRRPMSRHHNRHVLPR